ncbi:MAG: hypothetical protein ABFC84_16750 [Veillonellales bacterium]
MPENDRPERMSREIFDVINKRYIAIFLGKPTIFFTLDEMDLYTRIATIVYANQKCKKYYHRKLLLYGYDHVYDIRMGITYAILPKNTKDYIPFLSKIEKDVICDWDEK